MVLYGELACQYHLSCRIGCLTLPSGVACDRQPSRKTKRATNLWEIHGRLHSENVFIIACVDVVAEKACTAVAPACNIRIIYQYIYCKLMNSTEENSLSVQQFNMESSARGIGARKGSVMKFSFYLNWIFWLKPYKRDGNGFFLSTFPRRILRGLPSL